MMYLLDTNVLLRLRDLDDPRRSDCIAAVDRLTEQSHTLVVCAQVLIEFWAVATRPRNVNGMGLAIEDVLRELDELRRVFPCLPEPPDIAARWRQVVVDHGVMGRQAHDARIVALMQAHGIAHIVTLNVDDFTRYQGITPFSPQEAFDQFPI